MSTDSLTGKIINYSAQGVGDSNYFDLKTLDNELWLAAGDGLYTTYDTTATSLDNTDYLPRDFALHQNYPNPFNPSTNISYSLPLACHVTLILYDIIGNKIATLVNEEKNPGTHNYQVSIRQLTDYPLSSGVYFYRLVAGEFVSTKKMTLLK